MKIAWNALKTIPLPVLTALLPSPFLNLLGSSSGSNESTLLGRERWDAGLGKTSWGPGGGQGEWKTLEVHKVNHNGDD